jgi:hypothetical protein
VLTVCTFSLWNYNPDNTDEAGDDWNGENFSWFSDTRARAKDRSGLRAPPSSSKPSLKTTFTKHPPHPSLVRQSDESLDEGGRILPSLVRPYPAKVAGIPLAFNYDLNDGKFSFVWRIPDSRVLPELDDEEVAEAVEAITAPRISELEDEKQQGEKDEDVKVLKKNAKEARAPSINNPPIDQHPRLTSRESEIYVPSLITRGRRLRVIGYGIGGPDAEWWRYDEERQTLFVLNPPSAGAEKDSLGDPGAVYSVEVTLDPPLRERWTMHTHWSDFGMYYGAFVSAVLAVLFLVFFGKADQGPSD